MSSLSLFFFIIYYITILQSTIHTFGATIIPAKNKKVGDIVLTDEYTITFGFKQNSYYYDTTNVWANLFAIGNTFGSSPYTRYPSIFLYHQKLDWHVCMTDKSNSNRCTNRPDATEVQLHTFYNIKIEITQVYMSLYMNNTLLVKMDKDVHDISGTMGVWLGNTAYNAPDVTITNLIIETFTDTTDIENVLTPCGIPISELKSWYKSEDWISTSTASPFLKWYDHSKNGYHIRSNMGSNMGNIVKSTQYGFIYGGTTTSILLPYPFNSNSYTLFHLTKYNGATKKRIFTGTGNILSGFHGDRNGVAYHQNWLTPQTARFNLDAWVISTDQWALYRGNRQSFTSGTPGNPVSNPFYWNINPQSGQAGSYSAEQSDWAIYEILIFNTILDSTKYQCIENYIHNKYSCNDENTLGQWSCSPTTTPTLYPSMIPSTIPTSNPSTPPTMIPTYNPTFTRNPTKYPTKIPTKQPSNNPTLNPSKIPTKLPTLLPTIIPTKRTKPPTFFRVTANANAFTALNNNTFIFIGSGAAVICICIVLLLIFLMRHQRKSQQAQMELMNRTLRSIASQTGLSDINIDGMDTGMGNSASPMNTNDNAPPGQNPNMATVELQKQLMMMRKELDEQKKKIMQQEMTIQMQQQLMKQGPEKLRSQAYLQQHNYVENDAMIAVNEAVFNDTNATFVNGEGNDEDDDIEQELNNNYAVDGYLPSQPQVGNMGMMNTNGMPDGVLDDEYDDNYNE